MSPVASSVDPGALDVRMEVLSATRTDDGMAGGTVSYAAVRSVWARFEDTAPAIRTRAPVHDAGARGLVTVRLGLAPAIGDRLRFELSGVERTLAVDAVEPGGRSYPFDRIDVREIDRKAAT